MHHYSPRMSFKCGTTVIVLCLLCPTSFSQEHFSLRYAQRSVATMHAFFYAIFYLIIDAYVAFIVPLMLLEHCREIKFEISWRRVYEWKSTFREMSSCSLTNME